MKTLYTFGFEGANAGKFDQAVRALGALVMDIRHSPYSKAHVWDGSVLGARVAYAWAGNTLGNLNQATGGTVDLVSEEEGLGALEAALRTAPVILLCECANLEGCHRLVIADAMAERFGIRPIHLELTGDGRFVGAGTDAPEDAQEVMA